MGSNNNISNTVTASSTSSQTINGSNTLSVSNSGTLAFGSAITHSLKIDAENVTVGHRNLTETLDSLEHIAEFVNAREDDMELILKGIADAESYMNLPLKDRLYQLMVNSDGNIFTLKAFVDSKESIEFFFQHKPRFDPEKQVELDHKLFIDLMGSYLYQITKACPDHLDWFVQYCNDIKYRIKETLIAYICYQFLNDNKISIDHRETVMVANITYIKKELPTLFSMIKNLVNTYKDASDKMPALYTVVNID